MGGMTTFGNNDSVFSHGEDSISMLNRMAEIAKEAFKYIPENDCTVACGTFVDVDTRAFLSAVQHFRESIEAYRDLTEELDDDLRKCRAEYEQEREYSNQLEEHLTAIKDERDLAKKLAKKLIDEKRILKDDLMRSELECKNLKVVLDKKYAEIEELTAEAMINNPANFCGNCRHYAQMGKDDGDFEGICTQHYIKRVDPDDASCKFFKPTYDTRVVIGKPEFPVCEKCNRDDCDNCTLCPF